jgi:hypothetical protein
MPDMITFEVPADAPEADLRSVRHATDRAREKAQIRRRYPALREKHGWEGALEKLAAETRYSKSFIRKIVYRG